MKCPKCGAENNAGVKFCINCGSALGLFCPNCGMANSAGAKFCVSCGNQFGVPAAAQSSAPSQPVVVLKSGTPGWAWAFIGVLLGILIIGGSIISGILPFDAASPEQVSPTLKPVVESPDASAEGFAEPVYCPETGGVILYWNAGFDCANDSGDPGYRLRYGDGFQDLNTGKFDDQASSIHIPAGWSVRLYENVEKNGASHCFNTSVSNFEDLGNFDNRDLPINDNVTSMQVYRDGTCGQDLAAGAEPAPMPEEETRPEGAPGAQAGGCDCKCVRELFSGLGVEFDVDWWGWEPIAIQEFDEYIFNRGAEINAETGDVYANIIFDNKNGAFDRIFSDPNLVLILSYSTDEGDADQFSTRPDEFQGGINCQKNNAEIACQYDLGYLAAEVDEVYIGAGLSITYISPGGVEQEYCLTIDEDFDQPDIIFGFRGESGPGDTGQPKDCRDPLVSCPDKQQCIESKKTGAWYCEPIKEVLPPTEEPAPPEPEATECPSWCP